MVQNVHPGFDPHDVKKISFINLVTMYWTLNSIYMQFEYQYPKSSNVSVDHVQLPREMLRSFVARGVYCLKFGFLVARGMYCLTFGFFVARGMYCLNFV